MAWLFSTLKSTQLNLEVSQLNSFFSMMPLTKKSLSLFPLKHNIDIRIDFHTLLRRIGLLTIDLFTLSESFTGHFRDVIKEGEATHSLKSLHLQPKVWSEESQHPHHMSAVLRCRILGPSLYLWNWNPHFHKTPGWCMRTWEFEKHGRLYTVFLRRSLCHGL